MGKRNPKSSGHFLFSQSTLIKKFLHESFFILSCCFYKCIVHFHSFGHFGIGNWFFFWLATIRSKNVHNHTNSIDDRIKARSLVDWILCSHDFWAKPLFGLLQSIVKIRLFMVYLANNKYRGRLEIINIIPQDLSTYFYTVCTI